MWMVRCGRRIATEACVQHHVHGEAGVLPEIDRDLPPVAIALDGTGVQLGNHGGNLILQDDTSAQVDVVTYTTEDAGVENRYVRFRR